MCSFVCEASRDQTRGNVAFGRIAHGYETRNRDKLRPAFARTNRGGRAISAGGASLFNSLPREVREAHPSVFKRELKRYLLRVQCPMRR